MTQPAKLNEILQKEGQGAVGASARTAPARLKDELEQALAEEDGNLAKEMRRTQAETIIEERKAKIAQLRASRSGGSEGATARDSNPKEWLIEMAERLLNNGLPPEQVGRLLDSMMATQATGAMPPMGGLPFGAQQAMTVADMKSIFEMGLNVNANKGDPALAEILKELKGKVESLEKGIQEVRRAPSDTRPSTYWMVDNETGAVVEHPIAKPIVVKPRPVVDRKSIEEIREENRAKEEQQRIALEKEHKEKLGKTLDEIVQGVAGIGAAYVANRKGGSPQEDAGTEIEMSEWECPECHFKMQVPENAQSITCPGCKEKWKVRPEGQPKEPPEGEPPAENK